MATSCPFCARIEAGQVSEARQLAVAFPDAFPLTPGHTLVVPRRHEPDFFKLTHEEHREIWSLAHEVRLRLLAEQALDGFNLGVNAGSAAGQTVDHAHLHLVPRRSGDVEDPRGGVRWVVPARAAYWEG